MAERREIIGKLEAEVERLKGETHCAYCGESFPLDVSCEQIGNHIKACLKHPMRIVEAERDAALAEVERLKGDRASWAARSQEQFDRIGVALERVREHRETGEPSRDDATEVETLVEKVIHLEIESGHWIVRSMDLEREVEQLKEAVKRLPELTWKAERYEAICDIFGYARGSDVGPAVESVRKEWAQLRSGTTISVEQAQEASKLASQAAAVHTIRACAQWLRENGWHNSVRDTAIEMERLMTEDANRTYGTPGMCVPPKIEGHSYPPKVYKPEFDKLCARVEVLEKAVPYGTHAAQERIAIVKWIEKQIERYSEDTMRNDKECALARNIMRMLAAQIRGGEHNDE